MTCPLCKEKIYWLEVDSVESQLFDGESFTATRTGIEKLFFCPKCLKLITDDMAEATSILKR